jgi:Predicted sugar kinase
VKKKFKSIAIYSSINSLKVEKIASHLEEIILNLKLKNVLPSSSSITNKLKGRTYTDEYIINNVDLVVAIGGDGTLLSSARKFGSKGIPVLGINLGNLGFLTDIAPEDLTTSFQEVVKGMYSKDERSFINARVNDLNKSNIALNEVVIHSGSIAKLIEYELFINESFVYRQKADGIIISTPTGSTAYSLSGNGPIVHPDVKAITLLPMFPHSLNTRPLIVDEDSAIAIKICNKGKTNMSLDSHTKIKLKQNDLIHLSKAEINH